ncbi:MAG: pentapeptide repeat-containing protein, partial [Symploca sp. SIO3E6]|nr:pentapeptide repeat-containing protein [Caldora sp. SIO3E6]
MKASEVLRRYKDGRRDFSGECLRGQSFKGMSLAGADFSEADIRGTNFTNAYLRDAKFCGAKAGLQRRWAVFLVLASWLLSALSGIFSIWISLLVELALDTSSIENSTAGIASLIVLTVFLIVAIRKGLAAGFGTAAVAVAGAGALALAVALAATVAVAGALAAAVTVLLALALAVALAVALAGAGAVAVAVAVAVALLGAYLGWRSLKGDERDAWIHTIAIAFAAIGGTSFRNADLTDADFKEARLKSTDFRKANLTRIRWHNANKLDRVRLGASYLQDSKVRELVITGNGQNQELDHLNLRGVNLQGANLVGANFTGSVLKDGTLQGADLTDAILTVANLNEANLQDTNMSGAKLKQAQLDKADLTGATLTGAYIEDWGITTTTQFNGVRCDYVFMQLDDRNPHRKPDDWNKDFTEGEFVDFITPMVLTLDLYHNRVDDPRLIAYAWQKLVEENPEAKLELVSIEKRGDSKDKLLLRAEASPQADHSVLHSGYFTNLQHLESLPSEAKHALLRERGEMIRVLA